MTTQTIMMNGGAVSARHSLEDLVDRVIEALFGVEQEVPVTPTPTVAKSIHEAKRLRQAADLDGALAVLAEVDTPNAPVRDTCWAYSEWMDLVRRRFGKKGLLVYSPGAGRAAALVSQGTGTLEVVAVIGMRWMPGKVVTPGDHRGLRAMGKGGPSWS